MIIVRHSEEVNIFYKVQYHTENDAKRTKQRHDSMKLIEVTIHIDSNSYAKAICQPIINNIVPQHE